MPDEKRRSVGGESECGRIDPKPDEQEVLTGRRVTDGCEALIRHRDGRAPETFIPPLTGKEVTNIEFDGDDMPEAGIGVGIDPFDDTGPSASCEEDIASVAVRFGNRGQSAQEPAVIGRGREVGGEGPLVDERPGGCSIRSGIQAACHGSTGGGLMEPGRGVNQAVGFRKTQHRTRVGSFGST